MLVTYVLRPHEPQTTYLVTELVRHSTAEAVKLENTARADPATIAIVFIDSLIQRPRRGKNFKSNRFIRIVVNSEDLKTNGPDLLIPDWARQAGLIVFVRHMSEAELANKQKIIAYRAAINEMHRVCHDLFARGIRSHIFLEPIAA